MSQSQADYPQRADAGRRARPRSKTANGRESGQIKDGDSPPKPLSPRGRHGALRVKLLDVGNVLARDIDGSLSRVSLSGLLTALSDFLRDAGTSERADLGGGTPRSGSSPTRGQAGGGETKDQRATRMKRLQRKASDDLIISRLRQNVQESAIDGF